MTEKSSTGDRRLDTLRDRAFSKIIWGESEESVYKFLRKEGVTTEMADQFIDDANRARSAMLRRKSGIRFVAATIACVACGGLLFWFLVLSNVRYGGRAYYTLFGALAIGAVSTGIYALKHLWILISGKSLGSAMEDGT